MSKQKNRRFERDVSSVFLFFIMRFFMESCIIEQESDGRRKRLPGETVWEKVIATIGEVHQ